MVMDARIASTPAPNEPCEWALADAKVEVNKARNNNKMDNTVNPRTAYISLQSALVGFGLSD